MIRGFLEASDGVIEQVKARLTSTILRLIKARLFLLTAGVTLTLLLFGKTVALPQHITVCFTPEYHGGSRCAEQIAAAISGAKKSILVQAYSFTSASIAKALIEARKRGVDVRVVLDKSNVTAGYSSATFLQNLDVPVLIDSEHAIAHNKVMVIDARVVITGSFNFTKAAEDKNAENVLLIDDSKVAKAYAQNWQDHAAHSRLMKRAGNAGVPLAPTPPVAAAEGQMEMGAVVGNRRSRIYKWPGCPAYGTMSPENRVEFPSREAAEAAGYRAANNCP